MAIRPITIPSLQLKEDLKTMQKRLFNRTIALAVVGFILCTPAISLGWGSGGHMMVAQIAFERLTPHAKAEVKTLLAIPLEPLSATAKSKDFVSASHWADDLRDFTEFDVFLPYHFIDIPFSDDGTDLPEVASNNIVKALKSNVNILRNNPDPQKRARALRFIIHFVGDIHQPLHAATRVSSAEPEGDHGGNFVKINVPGVTSKVKLHSYWDGGLGAFPPMGPNFSPPPLSLIPPAVAKAVNGNPPTDPKLKLNEPFAFKAWADESFDLARAVVYKGMQNGSTADAAYISNGTKVARKRVAWAGYRLAALLNSIWP
jgi:S1/P1 Nuclease